MARLRVVAGEHAISQESGLEQIITVASVTVHPQYDSNTYLNDIALIFVRISIEWFNEFSSSSLKKKINSCPLHWI